MADEEDPGCGWAWGAEMLVMVFVIAMLVWGLVMVECGGEKL